LKASVSLDTWTFSGNESLAVYMKDILLNIDTGVVGSNIEIADCQGSGSSIPARHDQDSCVWPMLIYVISSRTGFAGRTSSFFP
jgi:hypothetical protein